MPPRRPGGKYKGAVGRAKGEDTLLKEREERRQQMLEEHIQRMEDKKNADQEELERLRQAHMEALRQKFMNHLVTGRKGNLKKFFKAWIEGKANYQKERKIIERDRAWRKSCSEMDYSHPGGCSAYLRLRDVGFQLPTDAALKSGTLLLGAARSPSGGGSGERPPPMSATAAGRLVLPALLEGGSPPPSAIAAPGRTFMDPFGARSMRPRPDTSDSRLGSAKSWSASSLRVPATPGLGALGATGGGLGGSSRWPGRSSPRLAKAMSTFMDVKNAEPMIHYKTGRRCLVDPSTMRMTFADVIKHEGQTVV